MNHIFMFRSPEGVIRSREAESAHHAALKLGRILSWDDELNTLDLVRHGRTEHWTFLGHREKAKRSRLPSFLQKLGKRRKT